jgi:HPt (histidine-containing phosphotransfer) domain-containing protein
MQIARTMMDTCSTTESDEPRTMLIDQEQKSVHVTVDTNAILKHLEGDKELLGIIINVFNETYKKELDDIAAALECRDAHETMRSAHQIKGAIANFGVSEAFNTAQLIEDVSKAGDLETASRQFVVLKAHTEALVEALLNLDQS